jgi:hypothetical protein
MLQYLHQIVSSYNVSPFQDIETVHVTMWSSEATFQGCQASILTACWYEIFSVHNIQNIQYLCYKTNYLNEEVNCTEPSPLVSVSCFDTFGGGRWSRMSDFGREKLRPFLEKLSLHLSKFERSNLFVGERRNDGTRPRRPSATFKSKLKHCLLANVLKNFFCS